MDSLTLLECHLFFCVWYIIGKSGFFWIAHHCKCSCIRKMLLTKTCQQTAPSMSDVVETSVRYLLHPLLDVGRRYSWPGLTVVTEEKESARVDSL